MEKGSRRQAFWNAAPEGIAFLCAVVMLVALPLVFHDAFFDINRFKVRVVITAAMPLAMLFVLSCVIRGERPLRCGGADAPAAMMALLRSTAARGGIADSGFCSAAARHFMSSDSACAGRGF